MPDEMKFATTAKLCQDILGAVVEGSLAPTDATHEVIKDTLVILASSHIKLKSLRGAARNAEEGEDPGAVDVTGKVVAAARGKFLSKLVRKSTLEHIVPVLVELKRMLERKQSPLLRYLMLYMQELLSDHKQELDDILASDRQLAAEIKYDMKLFEQEQRLKESKVGSTVPFCQAPVDEVVIVLLLGRTSSSFRHANAGAGFIGRRCRLPSVEQSVCISFFTKTFPNLGAYICVGGPGQG